MGNFHAFQLVRSALQSRSRFISLVNQIDLLSLFHCILILVGLLHSEIKFVEENF